MRGRVGVSLMVIALIHAAFGLVAFHPVLKDLVREGLWNTVREDFTRGAVVWFLLFAWPLFAMGQLVRAHERRGEPVGLGVAVNLTTLIVVGVVLMPVSGFWLALPAAVSLMRDGWKAPVAAVPRA
jgi:hypothetical protein